jgi:DNA-binding beta-propeller fold protein YncE
MAINVSKGRTDLLEYSLTIGIVAMQGRGFEYPTDTVVGKNGRLYVLNRSRDFGERGVRVTVTDLNSEYYGTFGHYGDGDGQMVSPTGAAEDSQGRIYISDDYTHRITAFDSEGNFVLRWGDHGVDEGEMDGPSGVAFDADDNLYVADTHNNRVQKFTASGVFLLAFGSKGTARGQFKLPWGVTVAPGCDVYVADWGNDRVQRFSPDGDFIAAYGRSGRGDGELHRPSGVAVDERGYMYVSDWGNERVQVLDANGSPLQVLRGEATLSKWAANFLEINMEEGKARASADLEPDTAFLDLDGPHAESAHIEKLFWSPMSVKLDEAGRLYVTEGNRHRIQVYQRTDRQVPSP